MKRRILAIFVALVLLAQVLPVTVRAEQTNDDCITFSSSAAFSLSTKSKKWNGTIEYSTDKLTWNTWNGSSISATLESDTYYLYVRGQNNTVITGSNGTPWSLATTEAGQMIDCAGNIETLRGTTGAAESILPMGSNCYYRLFAENTALKTAPTLSATNLSKECYKRMFSGCTSLTEAPALPAETLADNCYDSMLKGCTSLTKAPALPAENLAPNCYSSMFEGCTSLTEAPALPAKNIASGCYSSMFEGCTSLTKAPALPAENLTPNCYSSMFEGCTSLTKAPALPATTLASYCYTFMFMNCTSLTKAPALPATTLATQCYGSMFRNTSLTKAPALPATTLADICYNAMFMECKSLIEAPALPATALKHRCYAMMFMGCDSLRRPAVMSHVTEIGCLHVSMEDIDIFECCEEMYNQCSNLKIYTKPTGNCSTKWVCTKVEGQNDSDWLLRMFANTTGDVTENLGGTVSSGVTYYIVGDVPNTGVTGTTLYVGLFIASMLGFGIIFGKKAKKSFQ